MAGRRGALTPLLGIIVVAGTLLAVTLSQGWSPRLGLDLQGGASVVFEPKGEATDEQLDTAIEILRSRVDALGVAEPEIVRQGGSIVVSLPGIEDQDRALEVIGRTAQLEFRPVLASFDPSLLTAPADTTAPASDTTATTAAPPTSEGATGLAPGENAGVLLPRQDPTTTTATTAPAQSTTSTTFELDPDDPCSVLGGSTPVEEATRDGEVTFPGKPSAEGSRLCYQLGPVRTDGDISLVGSIVTDPEANIQVGEWGVTLGIKGNALDLFNEQAAECFSGGPACPTQPTSGSTSGQMAIVLDGVVQSALGFQVPSFSDQGLRISGSFTEREARDLALVLRYGSLPIQLEQQTTQIISATLGEDSLRAGLAAGFIGIALVVLYMLVYYRALGVVVLAGLGVWAALQFALISWLGETQGLALSLAGVTGIVVSIGVTVDSYVVYFERLKDEIRSGKTIRSSVDRGFQRAFRTILTADVSSFIGAFLLYVLTVGPVRGFAFFLGLSTVLDVIVAYFFTRPLVGILGRSSFFTRSKRFGVARGLGVVTEPREAVA